ncbi:MAG: hypothetical protein ACM34I_02535 [bacterium]
MKKTASLFFFVCLALISQGCASKYMKPAGPDAIYSPGTNESLIIFMRPSSVGGAVQSSVFDVTAPENILVGIVSSKTKVAYKVAAGERLFMVVGESADFMRAEPEPGKTYYALVTPRIGFWKARFSLKPVHQKELSSEDFKSWDNSCSFVENTDASYQWAKDNAASVQTKRDEYYKKWVSKPEEDRPVLRKEDGI